MNVWTTGFITASTGMLWTRSWRQIYLAKSGKRISGNPNDDQLKLHAQLPTKHPVVVVASSWPGDDDEPTEIVEKLTEKLKLSYDQSKTVQFYLDQDGKGYVLERVRITRSKDL